MSLFQPTTAEDNLRRTEKRLKRLERRPKGGSVGSGQQLVVGTSEFWPGTSTPPAYLIPFDGRTITNGVSTHSALAAVHPEWVSGSDILIPNYGGYTMVSHLPGDPTFGTKGAKVGSKEHTLTVAQMPSHSHNFLYAGIGYGSLPYSTAFGGAGGLSLAAGNVVGGPTSLQATGGGQAHPIVQPSAVGVWCVVAASTIGEYDPIVQAALVEQVLKLDALAVRGVVPSGAFVDGAGATVSVQPDGSVIFANATAVSVRNVFQVEGTYEVEFNFRTLESSASSILYRYMTPANAAITSYDYVAIYTRPSTGPARSEGIGTTTLHVNDTPITGDTTTQGSIALTTPRTAGQWATSMLHSVAIGGGNRFMWQQDAFFAGDPRSILFNSSAGTFSGRIRVIRKA